MGYKRAVDERKIEWLQKKGHHLRKKYQGAANLRSAPGGRRPSYATDVTSAALNLRFVFVII